MTEASPRPWRLGTSPGTEGLTVYTHAGDTPHGVILTMFRRPEDAALAVAAVNAYGEPTAIEADLRAGWQQSERRRRIAALVADHHRDCLSGHSPSVPVDAVIDAMTAVIAALGGATDPDRLGLVERPDVYTRVHGVIANTSGEAHRG